MKEAIVLCCLRDMVVEGYGETAWAKVLEISHLPANILFTPTEEAPGDIILEVVNNICKELKITLTQVADAFGEFWVRKYAPKLYNNFGIVAPSSRDFLMNLNEIHEKTITAMHNMCVPNFKYEWIGKEKLVITHDANMDFMPFYEGLIKGVGRYYEENISVNMMSPYELVIDFPPSEESQMDTTWANGVATNA